jgi:Tol biopolymer transport system component
VIKEGGRVDWCRKSNMIVYDRKGEDGYFDIYVSDKDTGEEKCLSCYNERLPGLNNGNPAWHPSCKFIAFQSQDPYLIAMVPGDLHREKEQSAMRKGKPSNRLIPLEKTEMQKEFEKFVSSPAVGLSNNVWIMNSEGDNVWQITHIKEGMGVLNPHFSPDGSKLIWSEIVDVKRGSPPVWAIKIADVEINNEKFTIKNIQTLRPNNMQIYKTHGFSPDGKFILVSASEKNKFYNKMAIYKMELKSGKVSLFQLTDSDSWNDLARFTPDGTNIVWLSSKDVPQPERKNYKDLFGNPPKLDYWIMNADGSNKRRLTFFNSESQNYNIFTISDFEFINEENTIISSFFPRDSLIESIALIRFK